MADTANESVLGPEQLETYFALMESVSLLQHAVEQQLRAEGELSFVQFQLLAHLADVSGRATMTELADGVVYSRSGLTHQAALLERAGLITRTPSPDDHRATLVTITDAGRVRLAQVLPGHVEVVSHLLFDPLTGQDLKALGEIMARVRDHMRSRPPRSAAPRKRRTPDPAGGGETGLANLGTTRTPTATTRKSIESVRSTARPLPAGVTELRGDVREADSVREAVGRLEFDSVVDWAAFTAEQGRAGTPSLALDTSQPVRGGPPLDDEHRGLLVEAGVDDFGYVGAELLAVWSLGDGPDSDRPAGDLRLAWPLRFVAIDWVDRGAVQGESWIPAEVRALARARHRSEDQFAVLEGRLDPGDPRCPTGSHGGDRLVPVGVEQRPHALRELRLCLLDIPPCRHAPMIA
jgi:DNA-binding MarR family transcriptional regulator